MIIDFDKYKQDAKIKGFHTDLSAIITLETLTALTQELNVTFAFMKRSNFDINSLDHVFNRYYKINDFSAISMLLRQKGNSLINIADQIDMQIIEPSNKKINPKKRDAIIERIGTEYTTKVSPIIEKYNHLMTDFTEQKTNLTGI